MSVDSTPPRWQGSADREGWGRQSYLQEPPEPKNKHGFAVVVLLMLAAAVLCVVGFVVVRVLFSDSPPAVLPAFVTLPASSSTTSTRPPSTGAAVVSGEGQIAINPQQGYINTLVTVTGQGWWPEEAVFIFLRSQAEADGPGYAYAAAVADDRGNFRTAFTFPNEMRWMDQAWADVIARGTRSEFESSTRFTLVAPTPTSTLPLPTARPTSEFTTTPQVEATPTATPFSTSTPEVIITDWLGEYFANPTLAGDPTFIRNDVTVDFNWGAGSPDPRIPPDQFSARWARQHHFADGLYRFTISSDDGVRFWVDGKLVVDKWRDGVLEDHSVDLVMSSGQHPLWLEYYEGYGGAMVRLSWKQIQAPTATPTPSPSPTIAPSPTAAPTNTPPPQPTALPLQPVPRRWKAEYYADPSLDGQPVMRGRESTVSFDWGAGSPGEGVPADDFSARWVGDIWLPNGSYRYYLRVDDGARVLIDGQVVIDAWHLTTGETYVIERDLWEGSHHFEIEYFEAAGSAYIHFWGEAVANLQDGP